MPANSDHLKFFSDCIAAEIERDRTSRAKQGYEFKDRGPDKHTIGDLIRAVFAIETIDDARRFHAGYLAWLYTIPSESRYTREDVALANIGWCFGEGMSDERIRMWREACGAAHPVFGTMERRPTAQEAFKAGVEAGSKAGG
jgi:hypothetical protein